MTTAGYDGNIARRLREHHLGVLGTYGGEYPYTSLISFALTNDLRHLIFATLRETHKYANLLHEPRVSVLIDNRSTEQNPDKLYAMTLLGNAHEANAAMQPELTKHLLLHHPDLSEFLSLPQTAFFRITIKKVFLVEKLQKTEEFDLLPE